ncbi:MAG: hypothetical protein H6581_14320 [Bacteroidia bacterium]|nr:hypothetical protein [Bacteroidia bacterium]
MKSKSILFTLLILLLCFVSCAPGGAESGENQSGQNGENAQTDELKNQLTAPPAGQKIEYFTLNWPWEDFLCDNQFCESTGSFIYSVYRLADSKKIVKVTESGATYCQGDSDYSYEYLFDQDGKATLSRVGGNPYTEDVVTAYQAGIANLEAIYSPQEDQQRKREVREIAPGEVVQTKNFVDQISDYQEAMKDRAYILSECDFSGAEDPEAYEAEALKLSEKLESEGKKAITWEEDYLYRKPALPGEHVWVGGTHVRVRSEPGTASAELAQLNNYDLGVSLLEVGKDENIANLGTHHWYKISFYDFNKGEEVQGWIFGAFVMEDVFP